MLTAVFRFLRRFPSLAPLIGETWNTTFVEVHHFHDTIDYADHFGVPHIGQLLSQKFAAHFSLAFVSDFAVPFNGVQVFRKELT